MKLSLVVLCCFQLLSCVSSNEDKQTHIAADSLVATIVEDKVVQQDEPLQLGAERMESYLPSLQGKSVALVVNQTSQVNGEHLVDLLNERGISIQKIFSPEHGFRGEAAAGEKIADNKDPKTGLPIVSLYGKKKKPEPEDLKGVDVILFDIQDVGVRFYTYLSTMHYVMEAAAENDIEMVVLDRPNPNGQLLDGPVLDPNFQSFVGMHPIPVAHGMTLGELAQMIQGEKWINQADGLNLHIVACSGYSRYDDYYLPVKPSPNLKNNAAIYLYPSLCFFEGTEVSCGRGTMSPFQMFGYPNFKRGIDYTVKPRKNEGAKYPKFENQECRFLVLTNQRFVENSREAVRITYKKPKINWSYLWETYADYPDQENFILDNLFIDKLAGTDSLRLALLNGWSIEQWTNSYAADLEAFKNLRKQYLIYPE